MNAKPMAAAALLISVFVAGTVSGFAAFQVLDDPSPTPPWRDGRPGRKPGLMGPRMGPMGLFPDSSGPFPTLAPMILSERLSDRLGLSEDQLNRIHQIMEDRRAASSEILQELGPRLRSAIDSLELEIREVLSDDQQALFDEFMAEDRELFRRRGAGRRGAREFP